MTAERIERLVERMIDAADARYIAGRMSTLAYERRVKAIDRWARRQYRHMPAAA